MKTKRHQAYDECVCLYIWYRCLCELMLFQYLGVYIGTLTAQHVVVCVICDGVDVRWHLRAAFAFVGGDHRGRVDGQPFVRIHRHTEEPGVGLRKQERRYTFDLYSFIYLH